MQLFSFGLLGICTCASTSVKENLEV